MADKIKLTLAVLLVVAGIYGFYHFAEQALLYRVLGLLAVMGVAVAVAATSQPGIAAWNFGRNAALEARKSVWPSRRETTQTTLMVMVMVALIGIVLWLFDMFLLWAVRYITGQGG
jgi:preprotein translocase subunit SecE